MTDDKNYQDMWDEVDREFKPDPSKASLKAMKAAEEAREIEVPQTAIDNIVRRGVQDVVDKDLLPTAAAMLQAGLVSPDSKHRQYCIKQVVEMSSEFKKVPTFQSVNFNVDGSKIKDALKGLKGAFETLEVIDVEEG